VQEERTLLSTTARVCLESRAAILEHWVLIGRHFVVSTGWMQLFTRPMVASHIYTSSRQAIYFLHI